MGTPGDANTSDVATAGDASRGESQGATAPHGGSGGGGADISGGGVTGGAEGGGATAGGASDGAAGRPSGLPALGPYGGMMAAGRPTVVRPGVLTADRDWYIVVECLAQGLVLQPQRSPSSHGLETKVENGVKTYVVHSQRTQFTLDSLDDERTNRQLLQTVQAMIERRQATVYQGEPPYRPIIRFVVHPDGLRAYYAAYPTLERLRIPMTRVNLQPGE
jgi:hypothetical protein